MRADVERSVQAPAESRLAKSGAGLCIDPLLNFHIIRAFVAALLSTA
jgi:hypothetical protein